MPPQAIKIGVLHDDAAINPNLPGLRAMRLMVDQCNAAGGIEGRMVELVFHPANGAHEGLPENAAFAWLELAAQPEIIGICGPGITDNALAVLPVTDIGQTPTINWTGTEKARGEWYFQFQAGTLSDEGPYLARLMAELGHQSVGVLQTSGPIGDEYFAGFRRTALSLGLEITSHQLVNVHEGKIGPRLHCLRESSPDCLLFLGMGAAAATLGPELGKMGWKIPRFGNIIFLSLSRNAELAAANEGLVWTDQYEPRNPVLANLRSEFEATYGEPPPENFGASYGRDVMTLMLEGLRNASNLTRVGLKEGLERIKSLPCATGGLNPVMGFGPWDRAAIKGPDLLMFRTVRNGKLVTFGG